LSKNISSREFSLYNERLRETLATKRKESLDGYPYNQDGRAAERVACLIMRMMKGKKQESRHSSFEDLVS
jgi:hypothetical protein